MAPSRSCKFAVLPLIVAVLATGGADPAVAAEPPDWLDRVAAAYRQISAVQATFQQSTEQAAFARTVTAGGRIVYRRGAMRWDYTYPQPQTYVVDAERVRWLQPSEQQVVEIPIAQAFSTGAPAALLSGLADIDAHFRLLRSEPRPGGVQRLILAPTAPDPQVDEVALDFDSARKVVVGIVTRDAYGNTNTVTFADVRLNAPLDATAFAVTVPAHWQRWTPPAPGASAPPPAPAER